MPAPSQTPVRTPVVNPSTRPLPEWELDPREVCPQQKREHASPDVSP